MMVLSSSLTRPLGEDFHILQRITAHILHELISPAWAMSSFSEMLTEVMFSSENPANLQRMSHDEIMSPQEILTFLGTSSVKLMGRMKLFRAAFMPGYHKMSAQEVLKILHMYVQPLSQLQFFWNVSLAQDLLPAGAGQLMLLLTWWLSHMAPRGSSSLVCNSLEMWGVEFLFQSSKGITISDKDLALLTLSSGSVPALDNTVLSYEFFLLYAGWLAHQHGLTVRERHRTPDSLTLVVHFPHPLEALS